MRTRGKVTDWKDEKGFGFVTPDDGGTKVFVHIRSFSNRQRRPVANDLVTYELESDARGRPQGVNIAFLDQRPSAISASAPGPGIGSLLFAAVFLAGVGVAVAIGKLPSLVPLSYVTASCVTFFAYLIDKRAALNARRRTPESTLHLLGLMGGWPGAMFAQRMFRHKTRKTSFQVVFWLSIVLNCTILGWLLSPDGARKVNFLVNAF